MDNAASITRALKAHLRANGVVKASVRTRRAPSSADRSVDVWQSMVFPDGHHTASDVATTLRSIGFTQVTLSESGEFVSVVTPTPNPSVAAVNAAVDRTVARYEAPVDDAHTDDGDMAALVEQDIAEHTVQMGHEDLADKPSNLGALIIAAQAGDDLRGQPGVDEAKRAARMAEIINEIHGIALENHRKWYAGCTPARDAFSRYDAEGLSRRIARLPKSYRRTVALEVLHGMALDEYRRYHSCRDHFRTVCRSASLASLKRDIEVCTGYARACAMDELHRRALYNFADAFPILCFPCGRRFRQDDAVRSCRCTPAEVSPEVPIRDDYAYAYGSLKGLISSVLNGTCTDHAYVAARLDEIDATLHRRAAIEFRVARTMAGYVQRTTRQAVSDDA